MICALRARRCAHAEATTAVVGRGFELLKEVGKMSKPILLKRGLSNTYAEATTAVVGRGVVDA